MPDKEVTPPNWRTLSATAVLVGLFAYFFTNALGRVYGDTGDFRAFYNAACAMLDGGDIYATGWPDYIYPPLLAFLYTPFGMLPADAAAVAMLCFILVVCCAAIYIGGRALAERFEVSTSWATLAPILCTGVILSEDKLRGEFQMWQTNTILLLMFCLSLFWLDRRPAWAGIALGCAFNIKYLPVAFLPYLLLRRRWTTAAAFLIAIPVFAFLPALLTGWDTNLHYLATAYRGLFRLVGMDIGTAVDAASIISDVRSGMSFSITSALARYLGPDVPNVAAYALAGGLGALFGAWTWRQYRRAGVAFVYRPDGISSGNSIARRFTALEWVGLIFLLLIFSPQSNSRHYCLLVFGNCLATLLLLQSRGRTPKWPLAAGALVLFLGTILPPGARPSPMSQRVWNFAGGISWCALILLATMIWFVVEEVRHIREQKVRQDMRRDENLEFERAA
jgi:Glycosyltransferase family 87